MWHEMAKFGKKLVDRGLVESRFGNISIRKGDKMLITTGGSYLDDITEKNVVEIDIDKSSSLDSIASSETIVHRMIYQKNPALAIIHVHPSFAVIESLLAENDMIVPLNVEGQYFLREIPVVRGTAGTHELAKKTAQALLDHKGVIVFSHGTFTIGKTLDEAYFITGQIEHGCKLKYYYDMAKNSPKNRC
jgi:L-fuculose-phosphate aldolase